MKYRMTETLALLIMGSASLRAATGDPFPDVNPHGYYGSMIMTVKVLESRVMGDGCWVLGDGCWVLGDGCGQPTYTNDVIVAVYADDEIRGKGSPGDPGNPGAIYLDVFGNEEGQLLHFKVWAGGHLVEVHPDLKWQYNAVVGTPKEPYILDIGDYLEHDYGTDGRCTVCGKPSYTGIVVTTSGDEHTVVFDDTSEQTVSIPVPITATHIVYNRQFQPGKPMSIFLPFAITDEMDVGGSKFYRFSSISHEEDKWVATMTQVRNLEANMPYIIMPHSERLTIEFPGRQAIIQTEAKSSPVINGWSLCGTYEKIVWDETSSDYGFPYNEYGSDVTHKLMRLTAGDYILPLHCYLTCLDVSASAAPREVMASAVRRIVKADLPESIEVVFVNEEDDINAINSRLLGTDNHLWYTLEGQRLTGKPGKAGIYIHRGEKILIRK